ncbi:hypothetical protein FQA39_LY14890 [Lamprigera yunnana]|nr:hypothetical protein FQA39_LY14890 [Lamprigera yunnana]
MFFFLVLLTVLTITKCLPVEKIDVSYLDASAFGTPSTQSGTALEQWTVESEVNPEEVGRYLEGDILFPIDASKNGLLNETARWPHAVVPYESSAAFTSTDRKIIAEAMLQYHKHTCIRFRPKEQKDEDWVSIGSTKTGCWSSIGRVGGKQYLNLQSPGCLIKVGTAIHEFLHVLGFHHEQNRSDRDSYVEIKWKNIDESKKGNFKKVKNESVVTYGVEYDYGSVMHYSKQAFSINGNPTIVVLNSTAIIGQRDSFSKKDLKKLRMMYNCSDNNENSVSSGSIQLNQQIINLGDLISVLFP